MEAFFKILNFSDFMLIFHQKITKLLIFMHDYRGELGTSSEPVGFFEQVLNHGI